MKRFRTDSEHHGMEESKEGEYVNYKESIEFILFSMNWVRKFRDIKEPFKEEDIELVLEDFKQK